MDNNSMQGDLLRICYVLLSVVVLFFAGSTAASPFCVAVPGLPRECIYSDTRECSKRAIQLGGSCDINSDEVDLPVGIGKYCLVNSSRVIQCIFPDRLSCAISAGNDGAICVDSSPEDSQPDPFREDTNRTY